MSILTDLTDGALVVTINRPEARNALNGEVGQGIVDALARASDDADIRCVVLTGAGDRSFCAGLDLKALARGENLKPVMDGLNALRDFPKPLLGAVNGACLGGGFEVMMFCDLVVAVEDTPFGLPEVRRGLLAGGGGTRLAQRLPIAVALELGLTGEPIPASEALRWGLINRVVPRDELLTTALGLAARIGLGGPLAVTATKRLMRAELGDDEAAMKPVFEAMGTLMGSEDAQEAGRAFAEKRTPVWKGR
ncbi:crotonobetainyl-CoA hydratase [Parafrankia irregularis]|uniref:Crotonobetainyl-CoA hydratase n=1 Tax=Parafrankia irregularis TaxID=795642 RepID=A0A0S4QSH9_9ACTN|nr:MULTISPECIES: enoyl-CoA hydratase-related protein [Parafrankia]MBE3201781.1 enoyl-CoA hydratase/isomerase family protein [Parafrankia sp. CH37]CUU58260.1 crotonobetainyl-CoA hydratase [Parafrankia irregularis]